MELSSLMTRRDNHIHLSLPSSWVFLCCIAAGTHSFPLHYSKMSVTNFRRGSFVPVTAAICINHSSVWCFHVTSKKKIYINIKCCWLGLCHLLLESGIKRDRTHLPAQQYRRNPHARPKNPPKVMWARKPSNSQLSTASIYPLK